MVHEINKRCLLLFGSVLASDSFPGEVVESLLLAFKMIDWHDCLINRFILAAKERKGGTKRYHTVDFWGAVSRVFLIVTRILGFNSEEKAIRRRSP